MRFLPLWWSKFLYIHMEYRDTQKGSKTGMDPMGPFLAMKSDLTAGFCLKTWTQQGAQLDHESVR